MIGNLVWGHAFKYGASLYIILKYNCIRVFPVSCVSPRLCKENVGVLRVQAPNLQQGGTAYVAITMYHRPVYIAISYLLEELHPLTMIIYAVLLFTTVHIL